jgi:hypothetical protein
VTLYWVRVANQHSVTAQVIKHLVMPSAALIGASAQTSSGDSWRGS